jgi:hypothetical protein
MKPILFNTEMVRAILDGRKTVTRRLIKPHNPVKSSRMGGYSQGNGLWIDTDINNGDGKGHIKDYSVSCTWWTISEYIKRFAPYQPGDILYVRETWRCYSYNNMDGDLPFGVQYKADGEKNFFEMNDNERYEKFEKLAVKDTWQPSLFMPKEAARIFLRVKEVRVERLQDITEEQATKEGIRGYTKDGELYKYCTNVDSWNEFHRKNEKKLKFKGSYWQDMPRTPIEAFRYLWNSTVRKYDYGSFWESNPWVWVIEFEQISKEAAVNE